MHWPSTDYQQIIRDVNSFDERKYAATRNFIDGYVSYFSPYISRGCISTKMVFDAVIKKNPKAVRGKFAQELLWRDYFQRLLQAKPDLDTIAVNESKIKTRTREMPKAVIDATTGIDAIDDAINALYKTGYMHNHFRMYTAALCCNIGKHDFCDPGKWLYYHLLDADIGSNFASWQWVAGHLTWKTYIADQNNINRYSRKTQQGTFLDKPYPQLDCMAVPEILLEKGMPPLHTNLPEAELPKLDDAPILLYTFYNLDPQWHSRKKCSRVLILEPSHFSKYPVSDKVLEFTMALAKNIPDLKIFTGEFNDLTTAYPNQAFTAKEHPILKFKGVIAESRDWIVPEAEGYFRSFSKYYLACLKHLLA